MIGQDANADQQFLSVAAAAERLGLSRLKVREAAARNLIPSRRDNQDKLRLDLSRRPLPDLGDGAMGEDAPPAMLMDLLFDEIEELHADLADAEMERTALRDLAGRQAEALDRAADRMERDAAQKARLSTLLDRALSAGERLELGIAERDRTIEHRNATIEQSLNMSERAVVLAAEAKPPVRKGFWRRLLRL
ncbi:MAG: hypothetical protein ACR2QF_11765 [Geminicoccaceae bacterium]